MSFVFIDESGDLGERGSKFLVLSALVVENPEFLERIIKNMRRHKFHKELKKAIEIKANKSSTVLISHIILKLNEVPNSKLFFVVLEKQKLTSKFLKENHDKLYNYVAGILAETLECQSSSLDIKIDKSKGKQVLRDDFNAYFLAKLKKDKQVKVEIAHVTSNSCGGLQFIDVLSWACYQKHEYKKPEFFDLIKLQLKVVKMFEK